MLSMSNVNYTAHTMNGIITISDGMGTTIENGTITTNTLLLKSNLEMEIDYMSKVVNIVGFTPIDGNVYLYDTITGLAVNLVDGVVGRQYQLLLPIDEFDCIFFNLSNANITSCGLWVGVYDSILNPTSAGSFGGITIGFFNYIIFNYTFTLTTTETLFYLYALDNNYIVPFTPLTLYVSISLTGTTVIEKVKLLELKALQGITGNIQLQLNQISQPLYGNILVLQSNIVDTTIQINNLYGNVSGVQSQIPPIYGNVLVLQSNIVNTTTQINNLYGNVLVLQGNIVNTTTQINNLYGNVLSVQSQIPPIASNISLLQTKTTAITYIPTTTTISSNVSIQGNVITNGQIDASNIAVSGFGAVSNTFAVGENLGVGNNIVHSGNIITGKSQISNTVITNNLLVNGTVINGNTQTQLDFLYNNLFQQRFRPVFNSIDPSGLQLYYPFTSSNFFNLTTKHEDGIRMGNLATGTLVYDASLTGLTKIDDSNRLETTHIGALPIGQHGLVINRTVSTTATTISFWFICTSLPRSDYWFITTFQNPPLSQRLFITIDLLNKIRVQAHTGISLVSPSAISVNIRYFVVFTSVASVGSLYVNGILNATQVNGPLMGGSNISGENSIMRDPLGNGLIGNVDDYRYYNRAITQTEIDTLYSVPPY